MYDYIVKALDKLNHHAEIKRSIPIPSTHYLNMVRQFKWKHKI